MVATLLLPLGGTASAVHPQACLDVAPETSTGEIGIETLTLTAVLREAVSTCSGATLQAPEGVTIDFEVTGASDPDAGNTPATPDLTCAIPVGGTFCTVDHHGTSAGVATIRGWIDHDGLDPGQGGLVEADLNESQETADVDTTDVVARDWVSDPAATVDCDDDSGPDTERETKPLGDVNVSTIHYSCFVRNAAGAAPRNNKTVKLEVMNGVNDPDAVDGASFEQNDASCTALGTRQASNNGGTPGFCVIDVGPAEGETGTAEICFWVGTGADGAAACSSEPVDEATAGDGSDTGNDVADVTLATWQQRSASLGGLDAELETDWNDFGQQHTIRATTYDQFGAVVSGTAEVRFEFFQGSPSDADGNTPGTPDATCSTAGGSSCTFTYTQTATSGDDLVCVWTNAAPSLQGTNEGGTCDGEGRTDPDDADAVADAPQPATDDVDVVHKTWLDPSTPTRLDCNPEEAENPPGTAHTITCVATDSSGGPESGVALDAEATRANDPDASDTPETPDFSCTTASNGACTFTHGPAGTGSLDTTFYRAWIDADGSNATVEADLEERTDSSATFGTRPEPDTTDVVRKLWGGPAPARVDAAPETGTSPVGTQQSVNATVYDAGGQPSVGDVVVKFELFGGSPTDSDGNTPQTPDFTCTTAGSTSCSITYTQPEFGGGDVFCVWVGDEPVMTGVATSNDPTACDGMTGIPDQPGARLDIVRRDWTGPPPAALLDCDDSNPPITEDENKPSLGGAASNETYTCRLTDASGSPVANAPVKAEVLQQVNDPDAIDGASFESVDYGCTTGATGTCQVTVTQNESEPGTTFVCFYYASAAGGASLCASEPYDEMLAANRSDTANDRADAVRIEWHTRVATGVDVEPEAATTAFGLQHVITAVVYDQFGDPFTGNTPVRFEWFAGSPSDSNDNTPESPDRSCTTPATSQCSIAYTQSNHAGTDVFCAWIGPTPSMSGTASAPVCGGEGLTDADDAAGTPDAPEPRSDKVDLVSKTWEAAPSSAALLDCDDSNPPITEDENKPSLSGAASNETYTCTLTDASGNPVQQTTVRAEVTTPVNDPDPVDGASYSSADYVCSTTAQGTCQITVTQNEGEAGTAFVCFYVSDATAGQSLCESEPYDEALAANRSDTANDLADAVRIEWHTRVATGLDVEPESATTPRGTQHVITVVVYDQFGERFTGNTPVKLEWFAGSPSDWNGNSPETPDRTCTTSNNSQCSFVYTQANFAGTDVFCAWIGATPAMSGTAAAPVCSGEGLNDPDDDPGTADPPEPRGDKIDVVSKTWT